MENKSVDRPNNAVCVFTFVITVWFCGLFLLCIFFSFFCISILPIHSHTPLTQTHAHITIWASRIKRIYCLFTFQRTQDRKKRILHAFYNFNEFFSSLESFVYQHSLLVGCLFLHAHTHTNYMQTIYKIQHTLRSHRI